MFAAEMGKRMSGRQDLYALFDSDGSYMIHHAPIVSFSDPVDLYPSLAAELLHAAPLLAAMAASRHDRSFRSKPAFLTDRPEAEQYRWGTIPVLSGDDRLLAHLVVLTSSLVTETELHDRMQLAVFAYSALHREQEAKTPDRYGLQAYPSQPEPKINRKDKLFDISMRIHACNSADKVLAELMDVLNEYVPEHSFAIYLSHDQHWSPEAVKPLHFPQSDEDSKFRAFTEGRLVIDEDGTGSREAVFPLRGKQGVYGVLCMAISDSSGESSCDADGDTLYFVSRLADTTGIAFENAKLYEQSNVLVAELRMINEITRRLNQSLKLQNIFQFAASELRGIFNAQYSSILELDKESGELIVRANEPADIFDTFNALHCGFSEQVVRTKEPIIVSDYLDNQLRSIWMERTKSRSLLAAPIMVEGHVIGVMLVSHNAANFFSYDNYKLLQTLSGHIGLAVSNALLHAEVRKMVQVDRLTGLFARHFLDDQIGSMQKRDYCGSLVVVDIDDFKKINDTHGHQVGDRVLIQVSSIVRSCIREGDIASRWGGEELAIYLSQVTKEQAANIAERVRRRVKTETSPKVTVSCGVSDWNWEDEKISVESLFYRADMALYKAKHSGKNQICIG
jgi:diguanylate cyclase (GGDEF)-like protein